MLKGYRWYRLDNSAMIYPMVITLNTQSLYRLGVCINRDVNIHILRSALNLALERYPFYKVELKYGFFRHYLDDNPLTPLVEEDDGALLKVLNFHKNRHFIFRVTYYRNRIFLDIFHGLCDGAGGMEFLKTIVYYYCKLDNQPISRDKIITLSSMRKPGETEDAFLTYYKKIDIVDGAKKMAGGYAIKPKGKQFRANGFGMIEITVSTEKLLSYARANGVTITILLAALGLLSVAENCNVEAENDNFVAFIPINLRKSFPSDTLGNFTVFAKCSVDKNEEKSLKKFMESLKKSLSEQTSTEEKQIKLSFTSLMDKLPILRFMPLVVKEFISKVGRNIGNKPKQTMIISNLGKIDIKGEGQIEKFFFNLNCNKKTPINMGIVSYEDKTVISFTRKKISTAEEKTFCEHLVKICGDVTVASNFRENCNVL